MDCFNGHLYYTVRFSAVFGCSRMPENSVNIKFHLEGRSMVPSVYGFLQMPETESLFAGSSQDEDNVFVMS